MSSKKFAILGATGQIGSIIVDELLKKGHKVRAIGRDAKKLESLRSKGAEISTADFANATQLAEAFKDCDGVFTMIAPDYGADDFTAYQNKCSAAINEAVVKAKVKKVLNLSSIGAQHQDKTGPIKGLYTHEQKMNTIANVDVLHFRPSYFMQNFYWSIPVIQQYGIVSSAIKSDMPMWMVSTNDIGKKAAQFLSDLAFTGKSVFEFVGPSEITQNQATEIIAKAIARPEVKYVQATYEEATNAMIGAGMKKSIVNLLVEMHKGLNEGLIAPTQSISAEHKGNISFENFSQEFSRAFKK